MSLKHGFTGEPTDTNNLVYLRNRYYNPELGTFVSMDPYEGYVNDPMSLNRYTYVHGNPVNLTDPSGLCAQDDTACISAVQQLETAHPNAYIYWPGRIDTESGVFSYPTSIPSNTPTLTPANTPTASPTYTQSPMLTPTPTIAVCPTPSNTSMLTNTPSVTWTPTGTTTPTVTPTPTSTYTPTPPFTPTALPYELTGGLFNPKGWETIEVQTVKEALDTYVAGRGLAMFRTVYLRVPTLPDGAGGLTVGNLNASIHPDSASINVLLSDAWASFLNDRQYGKWLVVHETNHAFLWLRFNNLSRQNSELGRPTWQTFVLNPADASVFPTQYVANNYDTGTEYLAEAMTAMLWDRTEEASPTTQPHVYNNSPRNIYNADGMDLDTWIRQVLLPGFIP